MKKEILKSAIILLGAVLFNVIFWQEKMGINTVFFTIFILLGLYFLEQESFKTTPVRITAGIAIILSILIVWHNSLISQVIYILNFMTLIGFVQQRQLRFLGNAVLMYSLNILVVPQKLMQSVKELPILRGRESLGHGFKLALIPAFIFPVFYGIYYFANPKFSEISDQFWSNFFAFFAFDFNISRICFFIFGLMIVGAAFWASSFSGLLNSEKDKSYNLDAANFEDKEFTFWDFNAQSSYQSTLILMISLNVLLLFNNVLDINYVWFGGSNVKTAVELKQFVHEGTTILIIGILLAIVVIQILYKGSLNFKENTKILRGLSIAWLAQNALLALSVGMRNWQYIDHYGLAYKRIGVFLFLSLVLFGLWLMWLKINEKRTLFFFISKGAWAIYAVLVAACFVNWDVFITKYNLSATTKSSSVDVPFLISTISDKNLYLLYENREKLLQKMPNQPFETDEYWQEVGQYFNNETDKKNYLDKKMQQKRSNFEYQQTTISALSWNYSDYVNKQFFKNQK